MDYEQSQCFAWWAARAIHSKCTDYRRGGGNNEGHIATFLIHVKRKKRNSKADQKRPRQQKQEAWRSTIAIVWHYRPITSNTFYHVYKMHLLQPQIPQTTLQLLQGHNCRSHLSQCGYWWLTGMCHFSQQKPHWKYCGSVAETKKPPHQ